jgi:hypothetical protein
MTEEDAKDEAEFVAATAKLHGIKLPNNKVTTMYALLYEAAKRAPNDEQLFIEAAREVFAATRDA